MAQPSDLVNPVPGAGQEATYSSLFSGGAPRMPLPAPTPEARATPQEMANVQQAMNADEDQQAAGQPMTFGQYMRPPDRLVSPTPAPGQVKDFEKEHSEQDESVEAALAEMRGALPKKEAKAAAKEETDDELDSVVAEVRKHLSSPTGGRIDGGEPAQFDENAGIASDNAGPLTSVKQGLIHAITRARAGLGRTNAEVKNAYVSRYGAENVQVKDGEIWFKRGAQEKFRRVDRKGLANGLDLLEDLLADNSGNILEGLGAGTTEAIGLGATAAASAALAGTPGAGTVPGLVAGGTAASLAAGAAVGTGLREGAIRVGDMLSDVAQRDQDVSLFHEAAWNMGANAVSMGLGVVARPGVAKLKELAGMTQMNRIDQLAAVRVQFDKFAKQLGYSTDGLNFPKMAEGVANAIDKYSERLGNAVSIVEKKAIELAKSKNGPGGEEMLFSPENTLRKIKDVMGNRVGWDDSGMPYVLTKAERPVAPKALIVDSSGKGVISDQAVGKYVGELDARALDRVKVTHAFETENGEKVLSTLVEEYRNLAAAQRSKNGVPLQSLLEFQGNYQHLVYDKNKGPGEQYMFSQLRTAAEMDRNAAMNKVFAGSGTAEEGTWKAAYDAYHKDIDQLTQFTAMLDQQKSASLFALSLVNPHNVERVQAVKKILGEGSKEWQAFRGEWFGHVIDESVMKKNGILETGMLLEKLGSYGKPVLNELLSAEEQGMVKKMAVAAQKIPYMDLLKPADKDLLRAFVAFSPMSQYDATRFRNIMHFIGKNKYAADFLLDEGFMQAAKEAPTAEARATILSQMRFFQAAVDRMKTATITRTDSKGKSRIVQILVPVGKKLDAVAKGVVDTGLPGTIRRQGTAQAASMAATGASSYGPPAPEPTPAP